MLPQGKIFVLLLAAVLWSFSCKSLLWFPKSTYCMCAEAASASPTACTDGAPAFVSTVYDQGISVPISFSSSESSNCYELRITNCSFLGGLEIIFPPSAPPLASPTAPRPTIYVTIIDSLISLGNSAGSGPSQGAGAFVITSANATASHHYAFVFSMRNTVLRSYASKTATMLFKNVILQGALIEVRDCEISRVIVTHASSCTALRFTNTPAIDSSISFVNTTIRVVSEMSHVNDVMFLTAAAFSPDFPTVPFFSAAPALLFKLRHLHTCTLFNCKEALLQAAHCSSFKASRWSSARPFLKGVVR